MANLLFDLFASDAHCSQDRRPPSAGTHRPHVGFPHRLWPGTGDRRRADRTCTQLRIGSPRTRDGPSSDAIGRGRAILVAFLNDALNARPLPGMRRSRQKEVTRRDLPVVDVSLLAPSNEELAAEHVIREHHTGACSPTSSTTRTSPTAAAAPRSRRLLDHPEIVRAVAEDIGGSGSGPDRDDRRDRTRKTADRRRRSGRRRARVPARARGARTGPGAVEVLAPDVYFDYRPFAVAQPSTSATRSTLELDRVISHVGARQLHTRSRRSTASRRVAFTATGEASRTTCSSSHPARAPTRPCPERSRSRGCAGRTGSPRAARRARRGQRLVGRVRRASGAQLDASALRARAAERSPPRGAGSHGRIVLVIPDAAPLELFGAGRATPSRSCSRTPGSRSTAATTRTEVVDGGLRLGPSRPWRSIGSCRCPGCAGRISPASPAPRTASSRPTTTASSTAPTTCTRRGRNRVPGQARRSLDRPGHGRGGSGRSRLGAPLRPRPFRPVLRGLLLTGAAPASSGPIRGPGRDVRVRRIRSGGLRARSRAAGWRRTCTPEGLPCRSTRRPAATTPAEIDPHEERRVPSPVRPA